MLYLSGAVYVGRYYLTSILLNPFIS